MCFYISQPIVIWHRKTFLCNCTFQLLHGVFSIMSDLRRYGLYMTHFLYVKV